MPVNYKFSYNFSQKPKIVKITSLKQFTYYSHFLKKEYILASKFENIVAGYKDAINIKDLKNVYIGHNAETAISDQNISENDCIYIKRHILNFYQRLCDEILKRINFDDKKLNILRYMQPDFFTTYEDVNYNDLVLEFSFVISKPEDFISEYKLLESKANNKQYERIFEIKNVEQFWHNIGCLKNSLDEPMFPNLYKLAVHVLTLPHSSACAERIFSKLALLKNKLTNKLKVKTCNSMLSALNLIHKDIEDWNPCDELIFKYRNEISKK